MNSDGITHMIARKEGIAQTSLQRHTTIARAAEALSRRNADSAIVELFMEAMQRLTLLAYEQDADGYCNIDPVTKSPADSGTIRTRRSQAVGHYAKRIRCAARDDPTPATWPRGARTRALAV